MINVFEKLHPIETETGIKIYEDFCDEKLEKYIVFTVEAENSALNGDDSIIADTVYVTIQLIVPSKFDYVNTKYKIRDILEKNDFCVTDIHSYSSREVNGTNNIRRIIFSTNLTVNH